MATGALLAVFWAIVALLGALSAHAFIHAWGGRP